MLELPTPKRFSKRPLVTVCGSFNRHIAQIKLAVEELFDHGAIVLSPRRPIAVDRALAPGFLLLDGDRTFRSLSIKAIEDAHLSAILKSDFVVIVCPGGYLGNAAAGEMTVAHMFKIPVYAVVLPIDDKLGHMACPVPNLQIAVANHQTPVL